MICTAYKAFNVEGELQKSKPHQLRDGPGVLDGLAGRRNGVALLGGVGDALRNDVDGEFQVVAQRHLDGVAHDGAHHGAHDAQMRLVSRPHLWVCIIATSQGAQNRSSA